MQNFPPDFLVRKFLDESPENLQKLSIYGKFSHQERNQVEKQVFHAVVRDRTH